MKILLIQPPLNPNLIGTGVMYLLEPLALETIAANLPAEQLVKILDMRIDNDLKKELDAFNPEIVGVTALTPDVYIAQEILEFVKKYNKNILTVIGGQHVTLIPEDFNREYVDVIVIGEGQETFKALVENYTAGRNFSKVKGIAVPERGRLNLTPRRELTMNLDGQPFPARALTKNYRSNYFRASWRPVASIITSRGCPFRCNFCSVWKREDGKYRTRSAESIIEELLTIEEPYISVADDNFLQDIKRAEKLYWLIKEKGIKKTYKLIARSDTIVKHPDLIEKWREIGTQIMVIGIESFRDEELKSLNKQNSVKNNEEAIRILHKNGIIVSAQFIINPSYTEKDFNELGNYVEKMNLSSPMFSVLTPLPGTDLYDKTYESFVTYSYDLFDYVHSILPTKLPREKFYQHFSDLFLRAYANKDNTEEKIKHIPKHIYDQIFLSVRSAYKY